MRVFWSVFVLLFFASCAAKQGSNKILTQMVTGKNYFDNKEYLLAKDIFLDVSNKLNKVWNKPEESKKTRQFWYEEGIKSFKGEPYERIMLFFYLGVTLLQEKEYGNAQASFGQAILQDAFAEEEQYRSDFAIAYFLQSFSQKYLGSQRLSSQNLAKFQELKEDFLDEGFVFGNTILLIETGEAPRKLNVGKHDEYLGYQRGADAVHSLNIHLGQENITIFPLGDLYQQASNRGSRGIDAIAQKKAGFKDLTKKVSDVSLRIGVDVARFGSNDDNLALAFIVAGIGANILSTSTKTKADTRHWSNLPNHIYAQNFNLKGGSHPLKIEFLDKNGKLQKTIESIIEINEQSSNIFYWSM